MTDVVLIGNTKVAILIPSRLGDLTLIDVNKREQAIVDTRRLLTDMFGGSSHVEPLTGSFNDDGKVVTERVDRIYSTVSSETLNDKTKRDILNLAKKLCVDLKQCCIGLEMNEKLFFVYGENPDNVESIPFHHLQGGFQLQFANIAFRQIKDVRDLRDVLAYDQWLIDKKADFSRNSVDPIVLATKEKRKAWAFDRPVNKKELRSFSAKFSNDDFVFSTTDEGDIEFWIVIKSELRGPRKILIVKEDGEVKRSSMNIILSILNASGSEALIDIIDRKGMTGSFFRDYSLLRARVANSFMEHGLPESKCLLEAQRLLGRLMVLRFLEKRNVMNRDNCFLENLFNSKKNLYHEELNKIFFDILDTPKEDRAIESQLPYLNGGLFERNENSSIVLPDELFDMRVKGSILNTFKRYEFTLDPTANSDTDIAIDPSMFGLVLESLCDKSKRKKTGIHYTPPKIARFMAREGIGRLIADRLNKDYSFAKQIMNLTNSTITEEDAQKIIDCLNDIKILDPAVGSGSLLMACLETLFEIFQHCHSILGSQLKRGSKNWSDSLRGFVQHSLFGVDIDEEAVEITKLRLWLSLVVEDNKFPRTLPDLTRNICCGDSLSPLYLNNDEMINPNEKILEFTDFEKASNLMTDTLQRYKKATGKEVRKLRNELDRVERDLANVLNNSCEKNISKDNYKGFGFFRWDVRFHDVFFKHKNKGFDLVIANPPYVRIQNLDEIMKQEYKQRFSTLAKNNFDLYYAFIEQSFELAGKRGIISFIIPNFSKSNSASAIRNFLRDRGAIDLWLDFDDKQIFEASVYVAVLIATSSKRSRKTFRTKCLPPLSKCDFDDPNWSDAFAEGTSNYLEDSIDFAPSTWRIGTSDELRFIMNLEKDAKPLESICEFKIGIQTSANDVFLLQYIDDISDDLILAKSKSSENLIEIEKSCLVKMAQNFKNYTIESDKVLCIWPYDSNKELIPEYDFKMKYPRAWSYLLMHRKSLTEREKGKHSARWWGFRSSQGVESSRSANKLIIPALMKPAIAAIDVAGAYSFTGSGSRGGGAWGIVLQKNMQDVELRWLLAWMNSDTIWRWITTEAERFRGGWRGIDRSILCRLPVRIPDKNVQLEVCKLTEKLQNTDNETKHNLHRQINQIITDIL